MKKIKMIWVILFAVMLIWQERVEVLATSSAGTILLPQNIYYSDEDQEVEITLTFEESKAYAGVEIAFEVPDGVEITGIEAPEGAYAAGPSQGRGYTWISFFAEDNLFSGKDSLVVAIEITAPSDEDLILHSVTYLYKENGGITKETENPEASIQLVSKDEQEEMTETGGESSTGTKDETGNGTNEGESSTTENGNSTEGNKGSGSKDTAGGSSGGDGVTGSDQEETIAISHTSAEEETTAKNAENEDADNDNENENSLSGEEQKEEDDENLTGAETEGEELQGEETEEEEVRTETSEAQENTENGSASEEGDTTRSSFSAWMLMALMVSVAGNLVLGYLYIHATMRAKKGTEKKEN